MDIKQFTVGARVRLTNAMDVFNVGSFPQHASGTVVEVDPDHKATDPVAHVQLDEYFLCLDHWDNQLQVFAVADECSEITEVEFELIPMSANEAKARTLLTPMIVRFGLGFHPDTRGADYVFDTKDTHGHHVRCMTDDEAIRFDLDVEAACGLCDVYELSDRIWRELRLTDTPVEG